MTTISRHLLLLSAPLLLIAMGQLVVGIAQDKAVDSVAQSATKTEDSTSQLTGVSVPEARRQAELLHTAMHATLQLVHHRYYREDEGLPIPAAVMGEVFEELAAEQHVQLRWLAVEGQAMNTDHKPRDQFERDAVSALTNGKESFEQVAAGLYRRAGAITLTSHCQKCHVPDRKSTRNRTAGMIVSIPVVVDK